MSYDDRYFMARDQTTKEMLDLVRKYPDCSIVDNAYKFLEAERKAHNDRENSICRVREEQATTIAQLHQRLAEANKPRG